MDDEDALRILSNIESVFPEDILDLGDERIQVRHLIIRSYLYKQRHTKDNKPVNREFASKKQLSAIDEWWDRERGKAEQ